MSTAANLGRGLPKAPLGRPNVTILLAGSSGIPGRNILSSLLLLKSREGRNADISIVVLKRAGSTLPESTAKTTPRLDPNVKTIFVDDFSNSAAVYQAILSQNPDIVISALKAEPAPDFDNYLVDAITKPTSSPFNIPPTTSSTAIMTSAEPTARRASSVMPSNTTPLTPEMEPTPAQSTPKPIFFINGFTLDLLHPSIATVLPAAAQRTLSAKINFAHRLTSLSMSQRDRFQYCTIVCASFLDYCLMKGYSGIDVEERTATLLDKGQNIITGCSLNFVGEAVAQVVYQYILGSNLQRSEVTNRRLRIAETEYSGRSLLSAVERVTAGDGEADAKDEFAIEYKPSEELLAQGSVIGFLNWRGQGASSFTPDGLEFGRDTYLDTQRRSLDDIVRKAVAEGPEAFEGIGR